MLPHFHLVLHTSRKTDAGCVCVCARARACAHMGVPGGTDCCTHSEQGEVGGLCEVTSARQHFSPFIPHGQALHSPADPSRVTLTRLVAWSHFPQFPEKRSRSAASDLFGNLSPDLPEGDANLYHCQNLAGRAVPLLHVLTDDYLCLSDKLLSGS